jgi:FkbM family methyltransferase
MLPNRAALWLARHRGLQPLLAVLGAKTATVKVIDEIRVEIPLLDRTGPGFYLNFGGPQAFYHYEEAEKLEIVRAMPPDGVFLDIGANIGLFSTYIAKVLPQARCFAFEPSPLLAECMRKTVRQSPFHRIQVEECCLSDREGTVELRLHQSNFGGNSMIAGNIGARDQGVALSVRTQTLDAWSAQAELSRVDVLKIDVQGAEALVLQGGRKTIARHRPMVLVEIENRQLAETGSELSKVVSDLFGGGYAVRIAGTVEKSPPHRLTEIALQELEKGREQTNYVFLS